MKVATWNVNSIKARRDAVLQWVDANRPDVLCLQELKTLDEGFPFMELDSLGYHAVTNPQKTYNGVAMVSMMEPVAVTRGMGDDDPQARVMTARTGAITVINAYFPNGAEVGSEKYAYKQDWIRRFMAWLDREFSPGDDLVLCGDFNIAASELDVHKVSAWEGTVIFNPEMREAMAGLVRWGFRDIFRQQNPDAREYSWWDYRIAGFARNAGLRIDYVMATERLAGLAAGASIDRAERGREKPSDHTPVIVEFKL